MARIVNILKTLRNNWKKTTFAVVLFSYGYDSANTKFRWRLAKLSKFSRHISVQIGCAISALNIASYSLGITNCWNLIAKRPEGMERRGYPSALRCVNWPWYSILSQTEGKLLNKCVPETRSEHFFNPPQEGKDRIWRLLCSSPIFIGNEGKWTVR